jgi:hypothetical protein
MEGAELVGALAAAIAAGAGGMKAMGYALRSVSRNGRAAGVGPAGGDGELCRQHDARLARLEGEFAGYVENSNRRLDELREDFRVGLAEVKNELRELRGAR